MLPDQPHHQDHPVADQRLGGPLIELASGIDALYLSGRAELPADFLARLEDQRQVAEGTSISIPFELGGEDFGLAPHGWGAYRFCLEHPDVRIGVSTSKQRPAIRVQPRSQYLHTVGPAGAVARVRRTVGAEVGDLSLSVSRLDLYADFSGWALGASDRDRFTRRADSRCTYEADGHLTGFVFGRRSSQTVCARIYDKTADVARSGQRLVARHLVPEVGDRRHRAPGGVRGQPGGPGPVQPPRRRRDPPGCR